MPYFSAAAHSALYYEYHRAAGPVVVLVHGWGLHCRAWDPTIDALVRSGHAVLAFDQRGCGRSDKDFASATIADGAGDLIALLDHLSIDTIILNGWSQGGGVAVEAARRLGHRCRGLVLTCAVSPRYTNGDDFSGGVAIDDLVGMAASFRRDKVATSLGVATACFAPGRSAEDIAAVQRMFLETGPVALQTLEDLGPLDQRGIIRELALPALVIAGAEDTVTPKGIAQAAHELIAGSRLVVLDGAAHVPMVEAHGRYHDELRAFVAEVAAK